MSETKEFNILRSSFSDCPDGTALVVFYNKCHMRCGYCHNHKLITFKEEPDYSYKEVLNIIEEQKIEGPLGNFLKNDWLILSGGEPLIMDYYILRAMIDKAKSIGMKVGMWTSLTIINHVDVIMQDLDFINVDFKTSRNNYHILAPKDSVFSLGVFYELLNKIPIVQVSTVMHPHLINKEVFKLMVEDFYQINKPFKWRLVQPKVPENGMLDKDYETFKKINIQEYLDYVAVRSNIEIEIVN